jgi:beta-glucoside operon transcriptional antiterminator
MKIIKKINTSVAIALDENGNEVVVMGKGIGFPAVPYELTDLSKIEKTFYGVNEKYYSLISKIPENIISASTEISHEAKIALECELNPNLPFTLADYLYFASKNRAQRNDVDNVVQYDVKNLYPTESAIGEKAIAIFEKHTKQTLSDGEATGIALQILHAEMTKDGSADRRTRLEILNDVNAILEEKFNLDKGTYTYWQYVTHMRYLINRMSSGEILAIRGMDTLEFMAQKYPELYAFTVRIAQYFAEKWHWKCNEEEQLYILMHLTRLRNEK